MTNEPSWDDIFSPGGDTRAGGDESPLTRKELREQRAAASVPPKSTFATVSGSDGRPPRKRKRRLGWLWALIIILGLGAGGAYAVWTLFEPQIRQVMGWEAPDDYTTTGNGVAADVVIASGDTGTSIAKTLTTAGVTRTTKAFYDEVVKTTPAPKFLPGTYKLQKEMSAKSALAALLDPKNRIHATVLIREGATLPQILKTLSTKTGVPLTTLQAEAKKYTAFGVPKAAPSLEGFLFPATYTFDPGVTAHQMLQTMVTRMNQSLDKAGVSKANRLKVLTLASIVQKEGGIASDFPKVSRVFTNRLADGIALQSDATVSYGTGSTSIFTTAAQRADKKNKYNTYANKGLPVGPISAPGDAAIAAALKPAKGTWLYFVLVNGKTGETKFSTTLAEHEKGVAQFQAWLKANPDYKTG